MKTQKSSKKPVRLSLRYKLSLPILIVLSLMMFLLFYTTFYLVRNLVIEGVEDRLEAVTEVFAETVKMPLLFSHEDDMAALIEWMTDRGDVLEVRIENEQGAVTEMGNASVQVPEVFRDKDFYGVKRMSSDVFATAVPIKFHGRQIGRVMVLFSQLGLEKELKKIFVERVLLAFVFVFLLTLLTSLITWLGIRPLFVLKEAANRILAGDLEARAEIHSYDEIEDLGVAFNEMVSRLGASLERLKARTDALEESEEKYRLVVENASDIIFSLTPEGEIALLNRGFSGVTADELLREGLSLMLSLHTEEGRELFQEALEKVMRSKTPVSNVAVKHLLRGSKSEISYLINLTPVCDPNGEVKLIQGVMRDITEFHRIEVMKESLVRDVAHELKTPAAKFEMALTWFEKEISKSPESKKYNEVIKILKNNVNRLMHTIVSIMDLTKLESGVTPIEKKEVDLNEILQQVYQDMTPVAKEKHLEIRYEENKKPLKMMGDAHMLYRLFANLAQNSIKYTDIGYVDIKAVKQGKELHVRIKDTGIGIEKESLETIFERFVQKTAASSGIGVGLTICRDIVTLHSGSVNAESAGLGQGSMFHVTLPSL